MKIFSRLRKMNSVDISAALRMKYNEKKDTFLEQHIEIKDPYHLFQNWLDVACSTPEILEPNAMCLSTVNKEGFPSSRFVLLKNVTPQKGFSFFTNYGSHKARDIEENPNVALTFYWEILRRQVRIEGSAQKLSQHESETYFYKRPRASQIGALASPQSQTIPSRDHLDKIENEIKLKYAGTINNNNNKGDELKIPLPNWGGYLIEPRLIEFWQGQTNRLHDRIQFRRCDGDIAVTSTATTTTTENDCIKAGENGWVYERLAP